VAADVLAPLNEGRKAAVLTSKGIHTDDTVVPVMIGTGPIPGRVGRGSTWATVTRPT
jgi:hypothetical protein